MCQISQTRLRILPNSMSISDRVPKYLLFIIIISPRSLQNNYPVNNLYHREPTSVHMPISSDQHTIRHGSPSKTATPAAVIIAFAGSSVILTIIMLQIIFLHYHPTKYYATVIYFANNMIYLYQLSSIISIFYKNVMIIIMKLECNVTVTSSMVY